MILRLDCWYYGKFIPPYVEGVLQSSRPMMCRRLQRHVARCGRCRAEVSELASTHLQLRDWARKASAEDISSAPPRQTWLQTSIADRVGRRISDIEVRARRRAIATQICLVMVSLSALLIVLTQPTPAREWIYHRFFPPTSKVKLAANDAQAPRLIAIRDPFQPAVDSAVLRSVPATSSLTADGSSAKSAPPPPPVLPESASSPTATPPSELSVDSTSRSAVTALRATPVRVDAQAAPDIGAGDESAAGNSAKNAVHRRGAASFGPLRLKTDRSLGRFALLHYHR